MLTPTLVSRTLPGGIQVTTETRTVDVTLIPFIRPRKIFFKAEGLLPNTRHRPFFDGVDVSSWCREETFVNRDAQTWDSASGFNPATITAHPEGSTSLIADASGIIEGSFYLPNNDTLRFRTGTREFKLLDWLATTDQNAISASYSNYVARGVLQTDELLTTTLLPIPIIPPRQIDPVAQSFIVDRQSGAFITSVDLYFQSKSTTVPVRVQIREMENGTPTTRVVPGADVYVLPASVNVESIPDFANAAHRTRATFRTPVYLEGFTEYAVVVLAESVDYNVWTAATTEFVRGSTTQRIMKQPSMGSFFKSQNGSTWTADQSRDLMFGLNRANFSLTPATAVFENPDLPSVKLMTDPIQVLETGASPDVRVFQPNHGLAPGAKVVLSGLTATGGLTTGNLNATQTVAVVDSHDSYIFVSAGTASSIVRGGGAAAYATRGILFNTVFPNINELALPETSNVWEIKYSTGESPMGIETPFVKDANWLPLFPGSDNTYNRALMLSNAETETTVIGARSVTARVTMTTSDGYLSPVVDLSRLSLTVIGNRIDNPAASAAVGVNVPPTYVAETDPSEGSAIAKHLTIPVTLAQPAIGLRVLFAANRPSDSFIDLYYRTLPAGSGGDITQQPWILAALVDLPPTDDDPEIFREYDYTIPNNGTDLDAFDTYQFKFVFRSQSVARVPRLRDLRAIALGT